MRYIFLFVLLVSTHLVVAQQRAGEDTVYYRSAPIPRHLLPIERAGGTIYFYGGKRLSSPYSLEIPFYELNDPTVTHHFRTFRTLRTLSQLTSLATLAYLVFSPGRGRDDAYWIVYGSSIAASLTLSVIGNRQVNKAVTRYNELLLQTRIGVATPLVPLTGQPAVGAGVAWSF